MKKKDELHQLVQSLDKSERRYFQLFAGLTGNRANTSYIELFNLLARMKEWDPEQFQKEVEGFRWKGNVSTTKTRLYDAILKSLRLLQEGKQPESRLRVMLEDIKILFQKGQYGAMKKRLKRLEKMAQEFRLPEILLQIQQWHRQILLLEPPRKVMPEPWEGQERTLAAMSYEGQVSMLHDHIRLLIRYRDGNQRIKDILDQAELRTLAQGSSLRAEIRFYNANGLGRLSLGNPFEALPYCETLFEFWKKHPDWIQTEPEIYLSSLNNYINCRLYIMDQAIGESLENLKTPGSLNRAQRIRFNRIRNSASLIFHLHFSEYQAVVPQINKIEQWLNVSEGKIEINHWLSIAYNLATFHFINDQFSKSNYWVLKLIGSSSNHIRKDLRRGARLLQLAILIQQGDLETAENLIRNSLRRIQKTKSHKGLELEITQCLQQYIFAKTPTDRDRWILNLESFLDLKRRNEQSKNLPGLVELWMWAKSRINRCSIHSILEIEREK